MLRDISYIYASLLQELENSKLKGFILKMPSQRQKVDCKNAKADRYSDGVPVNCTQVRIRRLFGCSAISRPLKGHRGFRGFLIAYDGLPIYETTMRPEARERSASPPSTPAGARSFGLPPPSSLPALFFQLFNIFSYHVVHRHFHSRPREKLRNAI